MTSNVADVDVGFRRIKGREARTQSIATRFTGSEERALLARAEANGQTLREWARDVLLRIAGDESRGEMEMHTAIPALMASLKSTIHSTSASTCKAVGSLGKEGVGVIPIGKGERTGLPVMRWVSLPWA